MRSIRLRGCTVATCAWLALAGFSPLWAQKKFLEDLKLDPAATAGADEEAVTVSASFTVDPDDRTGKLSITAEMGPGYHIYSITQADGGPIRTKIKLAANNGFELTGDFMPTEPPAMHLDTIAFPGVNLEEHEGTVIWTAPIHLAEGVDPAKLAIAGKVYAQDCNPPMDFPFKATLATVTPSARKANSLASGGNQRSGERAVAAPSARRVNATKGLMAEDAADIGEYTKDKQVTFRAYLEPKVVEPGGKLRLVVTAEPNQEGFWHIYAAGDDVRANGNKPTLIVVSKESGLVATTPKADLAPIDDEDGTLAYYDEPVTWTTELTVPKDAKLGKFDLIGIIGYQTCNKTADGRPGSCLQPTAVGFEATVTVGREVVEGRLPVTFTGKRSYDDATTALGGDEVSPKSPAPARDGARSAPVAVAEGHASLWATLAAALAGGLILNLMPCVLPVIGLKVMSFVEQGGQDRRRVLLLNVWYSLGILAVFMALATLPVLFRLFWNTQFKWGQHFTSLEFNVAITSLIFVMALSFLGVWEIPIPGFVGSGKANDLAAQEGFAGAFLKGMLTTVLATPCSGPFLGAVFAFAVAQPPAITYLTFGCIGLGMASPYLLLGVFPGWIRFLPKPGAWMDTFKQMMGFVLLGTVVWLFRNIDRDYFIPSLAFLFGLWFAFWWIGRTPLYADLRLRVRAWIVGAGVSALAGLISFVLIAPKPELIDWKPFSIAALKDSTSAGKTVLVDFTAVWCATCQVNEAFVLNTHDVHDLIEKYEVVPLRADWSKPSPEIEKMLEALKRASIPLCVIFPAGRPKEPIVLPDLITKKQVIDALRQAGPSMDAPAGATAMKTAP